MPMTYHKMSETDEKGFTLIEVMIAILVLAIGVMAVATMQGTSIQGNSTGRRYTEATATATSWLDFLSTLTWDNALLVDTDGDGGTGLDNGIGTKESISPDQATVDGDYNVFWNIADDYLINETKTVALYVTWQDKEMTRSVKTQYVIAQRY